MTMPKTLTPWLTHPARLAAAYVACVLLLYAPTYLVGSVPPLLVSGVLAGLLGAGAWGLSRWPSLLTVLRSMDRASLGIVLAAAGIICVATAVFNVYQYRHFVIWVDSPKFAQALWLVLHGGGLRPVLGMGTQPQTHVTPTLLIFLPLYALIPSHLAFLTMRNALLAGAAIPLFLIARTALPKHIAVLIVLSYLCNFPIIFTLTGEYHELHIFPPFFFLACWCLERERYAGWMVSLFLIGGIREEMGFVLLGCAALALVRRRPPRYWLGAAILGCAWLLLSYEVILGLSRGGYYFSRVYPQSSHLLGAVVNRANGVYLYQVGLPFLFVLPIAGWFCLPVLPVLLGILSTSYPLAKVAFLQYSLPVVAGGFYAMSRHMSSLASRCSAAAREPLLLLLALSAFTLGVTQSVEHFTYEKLRPPFGGGVGVPVSKDAAIARDRRVFEAWLASLGEATRLIPEGCRASVPAHVLARVPHQWGILDYGYEYLDDVPEYILVDRNVRYQSLEADEALLRRLREPRSPYRAAYDKNGVVLYVLTNGQAFTPCREDPAQYIQRIRHRHG